MIDQAGQATTEAPNDVDAPFDDTFYATPHGVLAWYRENRPVARVALPNGLSAWLVTRYEDVRTVLTDARFVNDTQRYPETWQDLNWYSAAGDMISAYGKNLSSVDSPEHDLFRGPIAAAFGGKRVEELRPRIQAIVDTILDGLPKTEDVDILGEFAIPLSVRVTCEIAGVPETDVKDFVEFVRRTVDVDLTGDVNALRAASQRAFELLGGYVASRRESAGTDLMGDVVRWAGEREIPDQDVVTVLFHLLVAGFDTTGAFIGNVVHELLTQPDLLARARSDPSGTPALIEEFLRFHGSARLGVWRFASAGLELGGQRIAEGDMVIVSPNAANRDPARFASPDELDLDRADSGHLAFGRGRHHCTGSALARVEAQLAVGTLVHHFPELSLGAGGDRLVRRRVATLNGWCRLPIRLGGRRP